jgi:hypothetical protein
MIAITTRIRICGEPPRGIGKETSSSHSATEDRPAEPSKGRSSYTYRQCGGLSPESDDSRDKNGDLSELQLLTALGKPAHSTADGILPLEIKAQNAGILASRCGDSVVFETFELSPTNCLRSPRRHSTYTRLETLHALQEQSFQHSSHLSRISINTRFVQRTTTITPTFFRELTCFLSDTITSKPTVLRFGPVRMVKMFTTTMTAKLCSR